jgi:phage replication-related protein YjqB (UPF0714/DUF867 family)
VKDRYKSFDELNRNQKRDRDFQIRVSDRLSATAIIAPHGGGIEPGTSELAEAIAGDQFCFYAFEGIKPIANCHLHVTSTRFNEPTCVALVEASQNVLAIHGEDSTPEAVFIGGLDDRLRQRISESLRSLKFVVGIHRDRNLHGRDRTNICNRSSRGRGVQLELTRGLRKTFFKSLSRSGRRVRTERFEEFVSAVRDVL